MIYLYRDHEKKHNLYSHNNRLIDACKNVFGFTFLLDALDLKYEIIIDIQPDSTKNNIFLYDISFFGNAELYIKESLPLIDNIVLENAKNIPNFFIVFSCSQEGFNINLNILKDWCLDKSLPENKIIFITGNRNYQETYSTFNHNFNIFYFPFFMRQVQKEVRQNINRLTPDEYVNKIDRTYYWLSLNKVPRPHRIIHLGHIHKENIQDKFLWSLSNDNHGNIQEYHKDIVPYFFWLEDLELKTWLENEFLNHVEYPKPLDIPDFDNCKATEVFTEHLFEDTYFSVVSETDISSSITFISEKIWKPIINLHPFIVIGSPNTLKLLHEFDFETFPEIFDESYDQEKNPSKRIEMINSEILRISKLNIEEIKKLYMSVSHKLIKNRNNFVKNTNLCKDEIQIKNFLTKGSNE